MYQTKKAPQSRWLSDSIIDVAQQLLEKIIPLCWDLNLHLTMSYDIESGEFVQILNNSRGHCFRVSLDEAKREIKSV